ncbi:MAG: hypothetical protein PHO10_03190, partial [Gemmiger sp.]|nr:hypothetical protein [Gemmiger sp.]
GFMALGMSAGGLVSFVGAQLLPMGARHIAAAASAALGFCCFLALKPTAQTGKNNKASRPK